MNSKTVAPDIAICELILTNAFPFHLIVNDAGEIVSCGESILRVLSINSEGTDNFFDHFTFQHPAQVDTIEHFKAQQVSFCLLKSIENPKIILRGQPIFSPNEKNIYFLVTPWVTELSLLEELGLTLNDFPSHSPLTDFLILLQAQQTSLNDSKRLSEDLSILNKDLEERVNRRTQALEENAQALRDSKQELEYEMNERARVEIELRHAHKLEAVGQLAAGIAHEINTPMQYIGNSLQFIKSAILDFDEMSVIALDLLDQKNTDFENIIAAHKNTVDTIDLAYIRERAPRALDRALDGISAVTDIVKAMNEFTHPDSEEKSTADINRALNTAITVSRNEYKYVAKLVKNFQPLPSVDCHIGDLNQVFLNLIVNAAHAISDGGNKNGAITISTWAENDVVKIAVKDNGAGIPEHVRHRVFDPFFTTKEVGRGTGQGLTISHKIIVNRHGGKLDFVTEKGKGTTFQITLPISTVLEKDNSPSFPDEENLAA